MLVLDQGKQTWPYTPPPPPVVETVEQVVEEVVEEAPPPDPYQEYMLAARNASIGSAVFMGLGSGVQPPILATFCLSTVIGYYTVFGVAPAIAASPLATITLELHVDRPERNLPTPDSSQPCTGAR